MRPFAPSARVNRAHFRGFLPLSVGSFSNGCACPATAFRAEMAITIDKIRCIALLSEDWNMKKLVLALSAVAVFSGSALAADLPARTYTKAPVVVETPSWTGFYIFGGGGGGVWDADNHTSTAAGAVSNNVRTGGDGWFGTVGAGYDWQFNRLVGCRYFRRWHVRQPHWLDQRPLEWPYWKREASGRLGCGRTIGLSRRSECLVLRQRWLYPIVLVGIVSCSACWLGHFSRRHRRSIVVAGSSAAASKTT